MGPVEQRLQVTPQAHVTMHLWRPAPTPRAGILILPAMGTPQSYYFPFANWLARQGFLAGTFDYRGIGQSRTGSLRGLEVSISDWAGIDVAAAITHMKETLPDRPLFIIGHSLGAQILGLVPNRHQVAGAVHVATGSGYWREIVVPARYYGQLMWHVLMPLLVRVFGFYPGRRLGMALDLPRPVMEQWKRWCLDPRYVGAEGPDVRQAYADLKLPVLALAFTDDELMSPEGLASLHALYRNACVEVKRIAPQDLGAQRIGHFGFFRSRFEPSLWPMIPRWVDAQLSSAVLRAG